MNKEKIIIQIVVVPLKETFSKELPQMMSTSEKLRSKLLIQSLDIPQPQLKKTNKFDQAKLFKNMQRQAHIAGLNSIGNVYTRRKLLDKLIKDTTSTIWELTDIGWADSRTEELLNDLYKQTQTVWEFTEIGWADSRTEEILGSLIYMNALNRRNRSYNGKTIDSIMKANQKEINSAKAGKKEIIINPKPENANNSNQNTSVWDILKAGSDFLQNFFEVEFVFTDMKNEKDKKFQRLMYTRVGSVEIPRLKNKTFTIKTASGTVSKIASKFEGGYETTLSIRPDQDCYIIDKLNEISGNYEFSEPVVFAPSAIFNDDAMNYTKEHRLDIVVKDVSNFEHDYGQTFSDKIHKKGLSSKDDIVAVNSANVNLNRSFISEWRLEDARIVGINDIEYSPDTASPPDIQLQVIAKMVSHHYYSKAGTSVDFSIA